MPTSRFTLAQVSDLHFNPRDPAKVAEFEAVRQAIATLKPDIVVASGDISDDGFDHPEIFTDIKGKLERLASTVLIIPGNHDVGDAGDASIGANNPVKEEYLGTWLGTIGADRFIHNCGQWTLIGINSQIIGSGFEIEQEQGEWFDQQLAEAERAGRNIAVFTHQPAYLFEPEELYYDQSDYWPYPFHARGPWVKRYAHPHVRLVASGHLHWYQLAGSGASARVWCPTTGTIVDDAKFPAGGDVNGFMMYEFDGDHFDAKLVKLDLPRYVHPFRRPKVELPGRTEAMPIARLCLDFTGTLSRDGELLPGVVHRLSRLARVIRVHVLTADTFNKAADALAGLPVELIRIKTGEDKVNWLKHRGFDQSIVIGNGRNDVPWAREAAISIAVIGPEGCSAELLQASDVVVNSIEDALDLVLNPKRLKATLRD